MKIVVLDGYTANPGDLSWEEFEKLGETVVYERTPYEDKVIAERIGDAEIVLTNKTPISAATMDACPSMRYVGVLATGFNIVDVKQQQTGILQFAISQAIPPMRWHSLYLHCF